MSHIMKFIYRNASVLSSLKYGALALAFALGYQVAGKDYPQLSALIGWVAGFVIGLKLRLAYANKR
jgi:hypothetical protein